MQQDTASHRRDTRRPAQLFSSAKIFIETLLINMVGLKPVTFSTTEPIEWANEIKGTYWYETTEKNFDNTVYY